MVTLYHASPPWLRLRIAEEGLEPDMLMRGDRGMPGIFLWADEKAARDFTHFTGFDVWEVQVPEGEALRTGNPLHPAELWSYEAVPPDRVRLL